MLSFFPSPGSTQFLLPRSSALTQDDRGALHLVYLEDRSYQEAADILGVSHSEVTARLLRARHVLSPHAVDLE
jgi:DNA-directed RNA polymerase specialized sigma24 family protein